MFARPEYKHFLSRFYVFGHRLLFKRRLRGKDCIKVITLIDSNLSTTIIFK